MTAVDAENLLTVKVSFFIIVVVFVIIILIFDQNNIFIIFLPFIIVPTAQKEL